MQLKKPISIGAALSTAAYSLLSHAADKAWDIETTALIYAERDRVKVNEDVVKVKVDQGNEKTFTLTGIIDVMTGASPTGASKLGVGNIYTSPSGGAFTADANKIPVAEFSDRRFAAHAAWDRPWSKNARSTYGVDFSDEVDYSSLGGSFNLTGDFFEKMTSLTVGVSGNYDRVRPVNGVPIGLKSGSDKTGSYELDRKAGLQGLVGLTQVLNRRALVQLNFTLATQSGYLNDPYKVVSYGNVKSNDLQNYYFESRPQSRTSKIFYGKLNYAREDGGFVSMAGRYYSDDWKLRAATADMKFEQPMGGPDEYAGLHVRFSRQSAASFYHYQLTDDVNSPDYVGYVLLTFPGDTTALKSEKVPYVSADYRLARLDTLTFGAKYHRPVNWFDMKMILDTRA